MHEEDRASKAVFEQRLATCETCPSFLRGLEFEGVTYNACGECFCPIVVKAVAIAQTCPLSKWGET
jgi:hypothetical protein